MGEVVETVAAEQTKDHRPSISWKVGLASPSPSYYSLHRPFSFGIGFTATVTVTAIDAAAVLIFIGLLTPITARP
jgi:hypothetical protein